MFLGGAELLDVDSLGFCAPTMISHRAFLIRSEFIYFHLPEEQTSNVTSKALYMQHLTISVMFSFIAKHTKVPSY